MRIIKKLINQKISLLAITFMFLTFNLGSTAFAAIPTAVSSQLVSIPNTIIGAIV